MKGLTDKLYWRPTGPLWHCFKKAAPDGYVSLCGIDGPRKIGGQRCSRPHPMLRCARCDRAEMRRRGWEQSGPCSYAPAQPRPQEPK